MKGECYAPRYQVRKAESDESISSAVFPWNNILRYRKPPLVPESQTGRNIQPLDFWLCLSSVCLLSSGVCLCGTALWIMFHHILYQRIIGTSSYLMAYSFSLCGGLTSLPCSWICWATHNNRRKYYTFLPLLLLLLCFSLLMLSAGAGFGIVNRLNMKINYKISAKLDGPYRHIYRKNMFETMKKYNTDKQSWDMLQQKLHCCGIEGSDDWKKFSQGIVNSCYDIKTKTLYSNGCLDITALNIAQETCLLAGFTLILCVMQIFMLVLTSSIYVWERFHRKKRTSKT